MVDGRPTGSVRVSFGYMSTFEDCQNFLNFVVECFVEKPVRLDRARLQELQELRHRGAVEETLSGENLRTPETNSSSEQRETPDQEEPKVLGAVHTLTNIFIYPVKSCAALEVRTRADRFPPLSGSAGSDGTLCSDPGPGVAPGPAGPAVRQAVDGGEWERRVSEPEEGGPPVPDPA